MSDDRDYWRRQDDLREERQREYLREDYRREDERRLDWEREDREYEARQREENHRRAVEEMRRGNTAWALNYMVGPDAAIGYLEAMQRPTSDEPVAADDTGEARWPPYSFVTTVDELLANVMSAPRGLVLRAERIDADGDAVVVATSEPSELLAAFPVLARQLAQQPSADAGRFWVRAQLLADFAPIAAGLRRTADVAADIERLTDAD
jgi:hypothetical protein